LSLADGARAKFFGGHRSRQSLFFPGFSVHDEMALLLNAGLTPLKALRAATINPARYPDRELAETYRALTLRYCVHSDLTIQPGRPREDARRRGIRVSGGSPSILWFSGAGRSRHWVRFAPACFRSIYRNNDVSLFVLLLKVPVRLDDLMEWAASVDDRS